LHGASTSDNGSPACFSRRDSFIAPCIPTGRSSGAAGSASTRRPPIAMRGVSRCRRAASAGSAPWDPFGCSAPVPSVCSSSPAIRQPVGRSWRSGCWRLRCGSARCSASPCWPARPCGLRRYTSPAPGSRRASSMKRRATFARTHTQWGGREYDLGV
jgi:hypothetical protein